MTRHAIAHRRHVGKHTLCKRARVLVKDVEHSSSAPDAKASDVCPPNSSISTRKFGLVERVAKKSDRSHCRRLIREEQARRRARDEKCRTTFGLDPEE